MPAASFFIFAILGLMSATHAYPTGLDARQVVMDTPAPPSCVLSCSSVDQAKPMTNSCVQVFVLCLETMCMRSEYEHAIPLTSSYCGGQGVFHLENGVNVTDIPPVPNGAIPTTSNVPLSVGPTTVIVTEFVTASETPTTTPTAETLTSTVATAPSVTPAALSTDNPTPTLISPSPVPSVSSTIIESMTSSTALRSPAAISVYAIISVIIILLILVFIRRWRRTRERDYIIPSHRRTRGTSFLIDEASLKRRSLTSSIDLTKPPPVYNLTLKEQMPLPALPIPTKDSSDPSAGIALSYIPQLAITRAPTRNYTALPGRSPSPERSPESEKSFVAQTFAAGRERAITNIRHSREGSRSPTSPASSISSLSSVNGDMYASTTRSPLPAYAYMAPHQPAAPSPLRVQLKTKPVPTRVSTIQEEPRTPHGAQSVFSMSTTVSQPLSVLNSKVETAQRIRPTFASHIRNPGSAERMRQFTFPNHPRQNLNEPELQITISEALMDDVPISRSQTPNGSLHRGAGGSVSSISKVQGKLQALVGGIRRDRD